MTVRRGATCPMCGKARVAEYKPFCSKGCRDRDLLTWFGEGYAIPVTAPPEEADSPGIPDDETDGGN